MKNTITAIVVAMLSSAQIRSDQLSLSYQPSPAGADPLTPELRVAGSVSLCENVIQRPDGVPALATLLPMQEQFKSELL
jgi:hypothetical protein